MTNNPLLQEINFKYPLPQNYKDNSEFTVFKDFENFKASCTTKINYQNYIKDHKFFLKKDFHHGSLDSDKLEENLKLMLQK